MKRLSSTGFALLVSFSASAQTSPPAATKQDDVLSELKMLNQKVDALTNAMSGPFKAPRVDGGAFASPFPVACHYNCAAMADNVCGNMGYARGVPAETPQVQGTTPGTYAYFICYGRK